ncbi:MAG TPA: AMP-binding protein [Candidatus Dormibacteraeota bacterium]|nr:AMP-binding protein [Candidatus Dormibacteraeota bacterium]
MSAPLPLRERTIPGLLERQAARYGDRPLVHAPNGMHTFASLRDAVAGRARWLRETGVERGDRVAFMCSNRIELLELMLACAWSGAIAVPLNTALRGEGLRHALTNSGARLMVADRDQQQWVEALGELPDLRDLRATEDLPAPGDPLPVVDAAPGDIATILYTSGTTGPSKGVLGPNAQVITFAQSIVDLIEIDEHDVLYTCLPLFHVNAWSAFFHALLTGARYHVVPRFSASGFWSDVVEAEATVTYLIGAMIPILLSRPSGELDRAHRIRAVNGMAPPGEIADEARERFGIEVTECYASTECGCALGAPLGQQNPGWMGRVMPGYDVLVVDADDRPVPAGEAGELIVRSHDPFAMFQGYFAMPEATVSAWRNLWFHTGDRVIQNEDGWFKFVDRTKDAIRRRGENISSFEVESVLLGHPGVSDVAVFPVPSDLGEEDDVMAAIVPQAELDPLELVKWCEGRIAYFAIPRYIDIVDSLPMTENGKVRKVVLRERGVGPDTWDLERSGHTLARPAR